MAGKASSLIPNVSLSSKGKAQRSEARIYVQESLAGGVDPPPHPHSTAQRKIPSAPKENLDLKIGNTGRPGGKHRPPPLTTRRVSGIPVQPWPEEEVLSSSCPAAQLFVFHRVCREQTPLFTPQRLPPSTPAYAHKPIQKHITSSSLPTNAHTVREYPFALILIVDIQLKYQNRTL